MSTKKAHSSALKNNQALSLFYLFFHFKSSLERAGGRDSVLPRTPWRGCCRELRAQLISGSSIYDPRGGGGQTLQHHSSQELWPGGGPAPSWRVSLTSASSASLEGSSASGPGRAGELGRQVSRPGVMPAAPSRPFCGAPSPRTTRSERTLEGSLAPGEPSGIRRKGTESKTMVHCRQWDDATLQGAGLWRLLLGPF